KDTGINQGFNLFDAALPVGAEGLDALRRDPLDAERVAEHWLDSVGTQRTFLFLHLEGPHPPYADVVSGFPPPPKATAPPYDGLIVTIDEAVDRLVRYLKSHQLYDQSAVVLVSSHGEGLGDHGE